MTAYRSTLVRSFCRTHERSGALHALRQQLACLPVSGSPGRSGYTIRERLNGGTEVIEARAQELVGKAWRQAQASEQKTMRLPSAPSNLLHTLDKEPQLRHSTAKKFAGLYAVCLRYRQWYAVLRFPSPLSSPAEALRDLRRIQAGGEGDSRTLVVGICCRWGTALGASALRGRRGRRTLWKRNRR